MIKIDLKSWQLEYFHSVQKLQGIHTFPKGNYLGGTMIADDRVVTININEVSKHSTALVHQKTPRATRQT